MTVSGMFTQGWMDDPSSVTVTVIVSSAGPAVLAADGSFLALVVETDLFTATVAGDAAFSGTLAEDSAATAALAPDDELQVQVSEPGIRAIITCD